MVVMVTISYLYRDSSRSGSRRGGGGWVDDNWDRRQVPEGGFCEWPGVCLGDEWTSDAWEVESCG